MYEVIKPEDTLLYSVLDRLQMVLNDAIKHSDNDRIIKICSWLLGRGKPHMVLRGLYKLMSVFIDECDKIAPWEETDISKWNDELEMIIPDIELLNER